VGEVLRKLREIFVLLMRMTMVVIMAAKKTKPPNTPNAIMPPRLSCCVLDLLSF
jgi:hypothetical protein